MTFSLVAYLLLAGQLHAYVLDSDLSYSDCTSAVARGATVTTDNAGQPVDLTGAPLVCEIED